MGIPKHRELFNPVLDAMHRLGGSATIAEMNAAVLATLGLSSEEAAQLHDAHSTEVEYRLAWARTYLKAYGLLGNSSRGVWVLTEQGRQSTRVDDRAVARFVRQRGNRKDPQASDAGLSEVAEEQQEEQWRNLLMTTLLTLRPDAFERLCQRILRESGWSRCGSLAVQAMGESTGWDWCNWVDCSASLCSSNASAITAVSVPEQFGTFAARSLAVPIVDCC